MHALKTSGEINGIEFVWEQKLDEVNIQIPIDTFIRMINIEFAAKSIRFKIGPLNVLATLDNFVVPEECTWFKEDDSIQMVLSKARPGEAWISVFVEQTGGHLDDMQIQEAKKSLLFERFEYEHPDFDFSNATLSGGAVPDAPTFLGGFTLR